MVATADFFITASASTDTYCSPFITAGCAVSYDCLINWEYQYIDTIQKQFDSMWENRKRINLYRKDRFIERIVCNTSVKTKVQYNRQIPAKRNIRCVESRSR